MAIARVLLILAAISLVTMPLTQHIWTWDHFLHGGQDFESGMLVILTILCLAVLLSQLCKRQVDSWFAAFRLLDFSFSDRDLAGTGQLRVFFVFRAEQVTGATAGTYTLPLRI